MHNYAKISGYSYDALHHKQTYSLPPKHGSPVANIKRVLAYSSMLELRVCMGQAVGVFWPAL